jgi:hypothetical protein
MTEKSKDSVLTKIEIDKDEVTFFFDNKPEPFGAQEFNGETRDTLLAIEAACQAPTIPCEGDRLIYVGNTKIGHCRILTVHEAVGNPYCEVEWLDADGNPTTARSDVYFNELTRDIRQLGFVNLSR